MALSASTGTYVAKYVKLKCIGVHNYIDHLKKINEFLLLLPTIKNLEGLSKEIKHACVTSPLIQSQENLKICTTHKK